MDKEDIDLGEIKSRDLGNMLSGELVNLGKEESSNDNFDYGDLPAKTLTDLGKQELAREDNHYTDNTN